MQEKRRDIRRVFSVRRLLFLFFCTFLFPHAAFAELVYVGGAENSGSSAAYAVSLTGLTGGVGTAPQEGDLVIVATGFVSTANGNPGVSTTGYAEIADLYANDTRDANFSVNWKIMGASPDTSVTCLGSASATNGAVCVVHVWRGADQTTPMDVTDTETTGLNSSVPNSPSITPVTSGAVVISTGLGTGAAVDNAITAPSGYSNQVDRSVDPGNAATVGIASKAWSGSGAEDPAAWTAWTTTTSDSWGAVTLAIRPASEIPPGPPQNFTTTSTAGGVSLNWSVPTTTGSSNLETYGIWRASEPFTATTSATLIASISTTSTSYSDTTVVRGATYYYRASSTNSTATSSLSNQRSSNLNNGRTVRMKGVRLR